MGSAATSHTVVAHWTAVALLEKCGHGLPLSLWGGSGGLTAVSQSQLQSGCALTAADRVPGQGVQRLICFRPKLAGGPSNILYALYYFEDHEAANGKKQMVLSDS